MGNLVMPYPVPKPKYTFWEAAWVIIGSIFTIVGFVILIVTIFTHDAAWNQTGLTYLVLGWLNLLTSASTRMERGLGWN